MQLIATKRSLHPIADYVALDSCAPAAHPLTTLPSGEKHPFQTCTMHRAQYTVHCALPSGEKHPLSRLQIPREGL